MIKAIIFDFDKMIHITNELFSSYMIKKYNLSQENLAKFFKEAFPSCRISKLDTREELSKYLPATGWKKSVDEFMNEWNNYGWINQPILDIVKQLRNKGIICVLCTNNEKYRIKYYIKKYNFNELFNFVLLSAELGYLKPEKQMSDKFLEVTKVKREEILFCDDKPEFIEAAKAFGFQTYHYRNPEDFRQFLKEKAVI